MNPILEKIIGSSIIKEHERGMRRYFPLKSTELHSDEMAAEVVSYLTGKEVTNIWSIRASYSIGCFDKYVEKFDGKFWVRTIYKNKK